MLFDADIPVIVPEYNNYNLICNGIIIPKAPPFQNNKIKVPDVQVFDFDGNLPINLGRNSLDTKFLPFENQIVNVIYLDYIEKLILYNDIANIAEDKVIKRAIRPINQVFLNENFNYSGFIYTKFGFMFGSKRLIENVDYKNFIVIGCKLLKNDEILNIDLKINDDDLVIFEITPINFVSKTHIPYDRLKCLEVAFYRISEGISEGLISKKINNLSLYAKFFNKEKKVYKSSYYFGNIDEESSSKLDYIEIYNSLSLLKKYIDLPATFENFLTDFFDEMDLMFPYNMEDRLEVFNKLKANWLKKQSITMYKNNSRNSK